MSSIRSRLIRASLESPELRPLLNPVIANTDAQYIKVGNPEWEQAALDARRASLSALPPCRCMGPTVSILDYGRGPIMDVSYGHDISSEEIMMMDDAVSGLGWRGWAYGDRGIAFKPTDVRLAKDLRVAAETRDPTPQEVSELRNFVRTVVKTSVTPNKSKEGVTVSIVKPPGAATGDQYARVVDYLIKNGWVSWPSGDTKTLEAQKENAKKYDAFYSIALLKKGV